MTAPATTTTIVSLDAVFDELRTILSKYARAFRVREGAVRGKRDYHLIIVKPLTVDGREKKELWFASVIQQKHNVGFYYMPLHGCAGVRDKLSPDLLQHVDGKSCFHFRTLTPKLKKDVDVAIKIGLAAYKKEKRL